MAIPFIVGGVSTVIPGTYSTFVVQNSLPSPAPAGRSVLILGEAEEGVPGSELDLRLNFFQSFSDVRDFYKSGPIVNAARMLFSNQPSPVFPGSIDRLYVYKTNNSTRAEREISSPSGYGSLVAARFGEDGNLIRAQILEDQAESKPSKSFSYLPTSASRSLKVAVNGVASSFSLSANETAADLQAALDAVSGLDASGGAARDVLTDTNIDVTLAATDDTLTITKSGGAADFDASSIQEGDIAYISTASALSGASNENAGAYLVLSVAASELALRQLKKVGTSGEENVAAFDTDPVAAMEDSDLLVNGSLEISVSEATITGSGATLELSSDTQSKLPLALYHDESSYSNLLVDSTSTVADISASVPAVGQLTVSLSAGSWRSTPRVGDLVRIPRDSLISGASNLNVGTMAVLSSSAQSMTLSHLNAGMTTESVAQVALAGQNDTLQSALSFVSSDVAARRLDSDAEKKVRLEASQEESGETASAVAIGGQAVLEIGYYNAAATAATLSITPKRELLIDPVGSGLQQIRVLLNKYNNLSTLATFLSSIPGVSARVPRALDSSRSTRDLDAVQNLGCLQPTVQASYPAKIKRDYRSWVQYFEDNFGLIAFREGNLLNKAGLPDAEASASFLSGATLGSTNMASIQNGLDAGLKVRVRQVVPLFSRDAIRDIEDGLTEETSSYSIDAIHAAARSHVSTASTSINKKYRFAVLSHDGDFSNSVEKVGEVASERCQMTFQRHGATDAEGELVTQLPYISACAVAAGRSQALLGTSLLRKPFLLSSAEHIGESSLFSDSLVSDFDPEDNNALSDAITAGLLVFRAVPGFGVRMESPDLTTRSRVNDPKAWVFERAAVLFTADEVRETLESVLDAYIGDRTTDTPTAVVRQALQDTLDTFVVGSGNGSLVAAQVLEVKKVGNTYKAKVQITPTEAIEAIVVEVEAIRDEE